MVFPEPDRLNPPLLACQLLTLNDDARAALSQLPSNDSIMARRNSRIVLGCPGTHDKSALDKQKDQPQTPTATYGGSPKGLFLSYPNVLHNLPILEKAASSRGLFSIAPVFGGTIRWGPLIQQTGDLVAPPSPSSY